MGVQLAKDSIDLGIVVRDGEKALAFYRDLLGFEHVGDTPLPKSLGTGMMHRLMCGTSLVKVLALDNPPTASPPPGGIGAATGYRYWTISVSNLEDLVEACSAAGHRVVGRPTEIRPGVTIAIVEDPEGNWVEFLQAQG